MPSGAGPPVDLFPSTHRTWIEEHLTTIESVPDTAAASAAHRELCAFIMARYHAPLCAYVRAAGLRDLGEPADLVASFFARTLDSPTMMRRWAVTGITLRRWLMNAISLHCRGVRRDRSRDASRLRSDQATAPLSAPGITPERAFDRAWALAIANEAHELARAACETRERAADYDAFRLHVVDGLEHAAIAARLGITRSQSVNAVRRVSELMRDGIRELLRVEGVRAGDLDEAVAELIALSTGDAE